MSAFIVLFFRENTESIEEINFYTFLDLLFMKQKRTREVPETER